MIFKSIQGFCFFSLLFLFFPSLCLAQEELLPYPGVIHIHSNISQGSYPLRKLVSLAQAQGIKILVFSDTFLRRWEYGLPIFSHILKVFWEENSVVKYGIKHYLQDLKRIRQEFPDMLILEGVELAPFYWWQGNILQKNLTLNEWNRHLIVVGLKKYQDYAYLPVVGNRYFLPQLKDLLFFLIPLSLFIWGIFLFKKRRFLGLGLNLLSILLILNFFPFSASKYSPYRGYKGYLPYQNLINYVHKNGGLVFWAHPEVTELVSVGRLATINVYTPAYPEALMLTSDYTGFGINMLPGTSHSLILAGGEWDKVLINYCAGKRSQPVWAIGEADYRGIGSIDSVQNIFLLFEVSEESAYKALLNGRLYIRYYAKDNINISLADFHIQDSQDASVGELAFMGDEIELRGKPRLCIKGNYKINPSENLKLEIIRDGQMIKEFEFSSEGVFDLDFQDDSLELGRKSYYRLNFFAGDKILLVSNPIFVRGNP